MRILFFGDSITHGVFDSRGGWATRIICDLFLEQQKNPDKDLPYGYNLGFSGDTAKHLAARLPAETEARFSLWSSDKDMTFVIAIGVNDTQVRGGKDFSSTEQYKQDLADLYDAARRYSDKILLVGMLPMQHAPWADQFYQPERIWAFERAQREFAQSHNLPFVALYEDFQRELDEGKQLLDADGLHPNDAGHEFMYDRIKPELMKMIGQN